MVHGQGQRACCHSQARKPRCLQAWPHTISIQMGREDYGFTPRKEVSEACMEGMAPVKQDIVSAHLNGCPFGGLEHCIWNSYPVMNSLRKVAPVFTFKVLNN